MAWGRHAPDTATTERLSRDERSFAEAERLDIDTDLDDRAAHAWEVDETDSWEPVVPDTWDPPADTGPDDGGPTGDEAVWSDSARSEREWAEAGADVIGVGPIAGRVGDAGQRTDEDVRSAGPAVDESVRSPEQPPGPADAQGAQPPTRMALGLASLAAQRMRSEVPVGDGLVTGIGALRQTANELRALGERVLAPASQVASVAVKGAAVLPIIGVPVRVALRSGRWLADSAERIRHRVLTSVPASAREHGRETIRAIASRLAPDPSTRDSQRDQARLDDEEPVQTFR
jgi:hypothetical protein